MDALSILKDIIEDGYLSDSNTARAHEMFDNIERHMKSVNDSSVSGPEDRDALLKLCKVQAAAGDAISAIKRYRAGVGCGLREAKYAVLGY